MTLVCTYLSSCYALIISALIEINVSCTRQSCIHVYHMATHKLPVAGYRPKHSVCHNIVHREAPYFPIEAMLLGEYTCIICNTVAHVTFFSQKTIIWPCAGIFIQYVFLFLWMHSLSILFPVQQQCKK